jgi:hypothetical protein
MEEDIITRIENRLLIMQRDLALLVKNLPLLERALTARELKAEEEKRQAEIRAAAERFIAKQKENSE